jgi:hypothetical protein
MLARLAREGLPGLIVLLVSATTDIGALRRWLDDGVEAKRIVTGRLAADARSAVADLAAAAGIDPAREAAPLVSPDRRAAASADVTREILAVVDIGGVKRQAVAATRLAAAPGGGGPLGTIRSLLERGSGTRERRADPEGYLRRWRERGALDRAVQPVRDLVAQVIPQVPPAARPGLAPLADGDVLAARLAEAVDRAVAGPAGRFTPPASRLWPLLGIGQLAAAAATALGVLWLVTLLLIGGAVPTGSVEVPLLGPLPTPVVLLVVGVVASFLLARLLSWHTGRLGRRWADTLARDLGREVSAGIASSAFRQLDACEDARRELWLAAADARSACAA